MLVLDCLSSKQPATLGPHVLHCNYRCCSINMQRRSAQEAADLLDQHAAAAVDLARRFREAAAPACGGSRPVPQSPRGSPATPRSVNADPMAGGVLHSPQAAAVAQSGRLVLQQPHPTVAACTPPFR